MAFNGSEGGLITLQQGADMTARYRANYPTQIKARFFGKDVLREILDQPGAMGLRMYFAQNASNHMELVICAVDSQGNDMLNKIGDLGMPCPDTCSTSNPLLSNK